MDVEEDSWDAIDWDQKISEESQPQKKEFKLNLDFDEADGNYYETNQAKDSERDVRKSSDKHIAKPSVKCVMAYSYKELREISTETDQHKMVFKVYGDLERYLITHEEVLSDEALVEVIKINLSLLQIPFMYHNKLLINRLLQIESFWLQIHSIIKSFHEINKNDPKYVLLIDMKGFFENIESIIYWLALHKYLCDSRATEIGLGLISTIESFSDDDNLKSRLNDIKAFVENLENITDFEIFPKLSDIQSAPTELYKNIIKGEYSDVFHYLQVQLPLLKEDFMCKLRNGFDHLKDFNEINRVEVTSDAYIIPNVKISIIWQKVWNINCPLMIANLNTHWQHEFFNGQIVCFTSKKNLKDLVVATVLKNSQLELLIPKHSIIIEVISAENLEDIFDHSFFLIEPKSFFDPYAQVFLSLKCLQEHNFPFKERILRLRNEPQIPSYDLQDNYEYKNFSFKLDSDWDKFNFGLEEMQMKALKESITNDFTLIVGPPGSGKSFIGIEIGKVLLQNTAENVLVLTQTNNALDKFLIGCLSFTDKIARFGGQSKAKELANFFVKRHVSNDSKSYLRKLQAMQRDIVATLIEEKADPKTIFAEISFHYRLVEEVNQLDTYHSVQDKRIFGMTTSFAAHNSTLTKMLMPGVVIIEEASEILESHVLAAITKDTKQVIMIGDHHQLRPQTNSFELQRKYNFNISLYERLIMNKFPHTTLNVQMRMRPEFCDLVRNTIYTNLKDGENVKSYPDVKGMTRNFFFLNHNHPESSSDTSKENSYEVNFILNLYKKLLSVGNNCEEITILTPYAAQAKKFKDKLKELKLPQVRIAVLDAYQGEESEIILLSLVRSNKTHDIGFLAMENRICVLLSRAKIGFYICGNIECFSSASKVWKQVAEILVKHNALGKEIPSDLIVTRNRLSSKN